MSEHSGCLSKKWQSSLSEWREEGCKKATGCFGTMSVNFFPPYVLYRTNQCTPPDFALWKTMDQDHWVHGLQRPEQQVERCEVAWMEVWMPVVVCNSCAGASPETQKHAHICGTTHLTVSNLPYSKLKGYLTYAQS